MKVWLITLGLFTFLGVPAAQAQMTVDVAKITCKQFVLGEIVDVKTLSIWLSGYFNAMRKNTVIDIGSFKKNSEALQDYCLQNHFDVLLMDAVKNTLDEKK